jgi:hypothetical protein
MLRTEINSKVRSLPSSSLDTILSLYLDLLNLLFGSVSSEAFWSGPLLVALQKHWSLIPGDDEQIVSLISKSAEDRAEILFRVTSLLGLELAIERNRTSEKQRA